MALRGIYKKTGIVDNPVCYKIWSNWTKERDAAPRIETVIGGKQ